MLTFFASVLGIAKRVPAWVWVALAAVALIALYGRHREAQGYAEGKADVQAQWDKAKAEGERIRKAEEARQAKLSKEADRAVIEKTEAERDRTERFIAAGGVRREACPRVPAAIPSTGSGETVHQAPVMDDAERVQIVGVTAEDVRVCTSNTLKAEAWRDLLLGLEGGAAKAVAGK